MYIHRTITDKLSRLMKDFPAVVVSGARQVGKSTLLRHVFGQNADYVLLENVIDVDNVRKDPELFLRQHTQRPLILDEIQYAPELVSTLKRLIDQNRAPGQYILTGSQQWAAMKSLSESLAGRAVFVDLEGFSLSEMANRPVQKPWLHYWLENPEQLKTLPYRRLPLSSTVFEILYRGCLPQTLFISPENRRSFFTAYIRTYIERDARNFSDVSDWQLFGRFVGLAAALTAQEINYSQLGRDLGLTPQTAQRWLAMLKATFQWFEVPGYTQNAVKRVSGKSKGYFADTGLACSVCAVGSPQSLSSHPMLGALFETAVVSEIRKQCEVLASPPNVYHWRSAGGAEVDLILERDGKLYPIEIKTKSRPSRADTRGISAFRQTYPNLRIEKGIVIAPTEKVLQISDNDFAIPWDLYIEA